MRSGIWVLCGFAVAWGIWGVLGGDWPTGLIALPLAVSALLIVLASRTVFPERPAEQERHIGRLILRWTAIEFAAIVLVVNALIHFHLNDAVTQAVVIIVGLHFVPLSRGIPAPDYAWTAMAMVLIGIIALFLAPPLGLEVAAFGSALVLWATVIRILGRGTRKAVVQAR